MKTINEYMKEICKDYAKDLTPIWKELGYKRMTARYDNDGEPVFTYATADDEDVPGEYLRVTVYGSGDVNLDWFGAEENEGSAEVKLTVATVGTLPEIVKELRRKYA